MNAQPQILYKYKCYICHIDLFYDHTYSISVYCDACWNNFIEHQLPAESPGDGGKEYTGLYTSDSDTSEEF